MVKYCKLYSLICDPDGKIWIFGFFLGVCLTGPRNLVFSFECLVSNGRRALLGGIRLGGSATLPCAHTQVCARDNKSVTCLETYAINRHRQGKSVTKLCFVGCRTQHLTPTSTQTISLPGHHFSFPPFFHE